SRITGLILTATGLYLVLYWAPTLAGSSRPNDRAWTTTTATAADWITTHPEVAITATATLLVLAVVIITVARASPYKTTRSRTSHLDSTPPPNA
ncbi:MAG: hypothetical protein ACRDTF_23695, partial [Pseudonocardiaceae bacterium]